MSLPAPWPARGRRCHCVVGARAGKGRLARGRDRAMPSAAPATLQAYFTERWAPLVDEAAQRALTVPFYAAMSPEDRAVAMNNILGLFLEALGDDPESATLA